MYRHNDNETWVVEAGDAVITKRAEGVSLSPLERLVYCLWVADYGMRNAGDLDTARDLYQGFQAEAAGLARELGLLFTRQSFELPTEVLQAEYFGRFDRICAELQGAFTL
jgi:hypothetical protein